MRRYFAISAIGKDRPGIVADVAGLIYEMGCNMEESRMTILANQFALLTLLSGSDNQLASGLSAGCKRLQEEKNLAVFFTPLETHEVAGPEQIKGTSYALTAEGVDKAGIVFKVCRVLAAYNINIINMETHAIPSPESGTPIYTMAIEIVIPEDCPMEELHARLSTVSEELAIEIELEKQKG
jgi:glycine cleavage system transcriptional repressor